MLLWTTWAGDPQADPSDQLMILNGIYDGDIQRFERVSHEQTAAGAWNLYRVRSAVVKRWRLQRYPFDDQMLHVQIGLADPLAVVNLDVADPVHLPCLLVWCSRAGRSSSPVPMPRASA